MTPNKPIPAAPALPEITISSGNVFRDIGLPEDEAIELDKQARAMAALPDVAGGEKEILGIQKGRPFEHARDPELEVEILVTRFANALRKKLLKSEAKYGWKNGWMKDGWNADLNRDLRLHVEKGDPLDVAAYCAFAWHHEWSIADTPAGEQRGDTPTISPDELADHHTGLSGFESQKAQPLPARPKMRSGDMASHYAIDETNVYMNYLEAELSRLTSKEEQGGWIERKQQAISVLEWADQGDHEHAMDCVKEALDLLWPTPPDSRKD